MMALKVAIVRGSNLNPFEIQSYAPLASKYDLTGYAAYNNHYELNGITFPVKRLHIAEEYYGGLPWPLNSLVYGMILPYGMNFKMFGLEKELSDKDILHAAETYNGYSYQCARVRKGSNKKMVLTVWENIPFQSVRTFKGITNNEAIVRYVQENTDVFIAVTDRARAALMIEGVADERIRVIPAGVDTLRFKPKSPDPAMREKLGFGDDNIGVLFMGRLEREKGVYDLLYAARLLALDADMEGVKIAMVGSGPEKERLVRLARELKVDRIVNLIGSLPYDETPMAYNAADVFILPSIPVHFWQEQFGMVLIEAMSSGLPVISTLSGSIPEVIGENGILIPPNDPLSIYNEMKRLVTDESARNKYSRLGRERALQIFDVKIISKKIEAVYKELS